MHQSSVFQDISSPKPFKVEIPNDEVDRMRRLISDTRLPEEPVVPGVGWDYGVDLAWLQKMRDAWLNEYEWRKVEREMNGLNHFLVTIESVSVHFIHHPSTRPDAVPILLTHGWPGSFWEFHKMVEPLTNPPAGQPSFHVVIPSLPGFGFSGPPPKKMWDMQDNARILDYLMTGVLGYSSYMAQGGDWGAIMATVLGSAKFPACRLINLNMCGVSPPKTAFLTLPLFALPTSWRQWVMGFIYTEEEQRDFSRTVGVVKNILGYFVPQATRPLSIGYALYDSPMGLLVWIGERYKDLVDPEILPWLKEDILTTISIYFFTHTFHSAALPYYENAGLVRKNLVITKPLGLSRFPFDINISPISWVKALHPNVVFVQRHERGGHFPGLEVPELLVGDLREMIVKNGALFGHA